MSFADWNAGATQVKWNRQDENIIASSHDKFLKIWDKRKGAYPLKTIEAHSTKIYGVDWNRTRVTGILTCSLDRTVKFWDYLQASDEPERVIRTNFPVWRARYTPFGWGVLAMPQRGDYNLHLYDRRLSQGVNRDDHVEPVHSFTGHENTVREFLWRFRGSIDDSIDNRDFQLVSWGADKYLRLHRVDLSWEVAVGYKKGEEVRKKLMISRLGAWYHSFRDETGRGEDTSLDLPGNRTFKPQVGGLTKAFSSTNSVSGSGLLPSSLRTYGRKRVKKPENPMKWIEGVKIGSRSLGHESPLQRELDRPGETPETLSEEMTFVAKRYKKVAFEKADVHGRSAKVSLSGPWGTEGKSVLLRLNFEFPVTYPLQATPEITFERTHSGVPEDVIRKLQVEVSSIIEHYRTRRRGCLEAVITYLLGEKNMEESMVLKPHDGLEVPFGTPVDEDSSDEEDPPINTEDLETSATVLAPQTNVPFPRTCSAIWGADGQLICFFPPKAEPAPVFSLATIRGADKTRNLPRHFEVFGRLKERPLTATEKHRDSDDERDTSSSGSLSETSSSSSDESTGVSRLPARFKPPKAWRAAVLRNQKPSSHSSSGPTVKKGEETKTKAIIAIHDLSRMLPSKKALAEDYKIFGSGPDVCQHNSDVAASLGFYTLAAVWELCREILFDNVPLEKLSSKRKNEPILVLARRNAVRIKRKDSGLDLKYDEPDSVANPSLTGRVKWGKHPLSSSWLIPALFDHYEKESDVQMVGMLACIFLEPAVQAGIHNALQTMDPEDLPISVKAPAFTLDYFPSREAAISISEKRLTPRIATPSISTSHFEDYFSRHTRNYGSLGSSNGNQGDIPQSEPVTPFSTENTPPSLSRQNTFTSSLSTSPDTQNTRVSRRSNSTISSAFVSMTRPFSINVSSSPPVHERIKGETDLSTSAPTNSIAWKINTSFTGSSPSSPVVRRKSNPRNASFATHDSAYSTDDETEYPTTDDEDAITLSHSVQITSPKVSIVLKNQGMFDDEGCAFVPLLNPPTSPKWATYRAIYAKLLARWGLHIAQAEVLKFNGMITNVPLHRPPDNGLTLLNTVSFEMPRPSGPFLKPLTRPPSFQSATQSSRNASTSSSLSRPLDPTATPFVPQPHVNSGIMRTTTHSSQSDVHGILSVPRSGTPPLGSEKFDFSVNRRDSANAPPSLLQRATSRARLDVEGKQSKRSDTTGVARPHERACVVCWEYVHGLHIVCREGKHRAHMECLNGQEHLHGWGNGLSHSGIGCSCDDLGVHGI
jgi:WD repeat-containing protein 59